MATTRTITIRLSCIVVMTLALLYVGSRFDVVSPRKLTAVNKQSSDDRGGLVAIPEHSQGKYSPWTVWDGRTCGKLHDLSDDYPYSTPDVRTDMLDELRSCGMTPRLLTRAVRRDDDDNTSLVVPNVVHYILFEKARNKTKFEFQHYVSFCSASRFIRPRYIFLHGDQMPEGEWWQRTLRDVDNLYHVYCKKPTQIHGRTISYIEHAADIKRLTLLIGKSVSRI